MKILCAASAADQTKMAILILENDEEWKKLGGRLLVPIHDELLCEVPKENYKKGGELLSKLMCDAADFLPFPSKCDVETSLRWYGLEYPCPYSEPKFMKTNIEELDDESIKWLQYHLIECEYTMPCIERDDGSPLLGNESKGINGKVSKELDAAILDYMEKYHLNEETFIPHIKAKVQDGVLI